MDENIWPESGDFVVCAVKSVTDFGAYTTLEEFDGKEGFIHISEIKAGWVKYVRDHVREGQKVVCKVLNVDPSRRHIDLSLKDVNEHQKRAKIQDWKNEQKAFKWLQFVSEETGTDEEEMDKLKLKLLESFGSLYSAFEEAAINAEDAFNEVKMKKKLVSSIVSVAQSNIKLPFVDIAGFIDLNCYLPDGIEIIKEALNAGNDVDKEEGIRVEISYTGAPRYRIKVIAPDYKKAEAVLKKSATAAISTIEKLGGKGEFHRHNDTVKA
ncbi:translation initiation factor IF-2 subunit alpha [Methanolobus mangrovi]|uniref:Translation initiation factor 2 subunit alpha n=1 Tax=Methanolobus mangrovi TaxID=3072977 RepID=A0AA51UE58_9EURY|nr:translation initiation factor IF-2 subunit alpha [Methanolobus mangrovi]WMW21308.1 translation initiation factor IF-2 subunit alpha [Methanolobus mangrovi]